MEWPFGNKKTPKNTSQANELPEIPAAEIEAAYKQFENQPRESGLTIAQEEDARQAGTREDIATYEKSLAKTEIEAWAEKHDGNAGHHIYDIVRIAQKSGITSDAFPEPSFQENVRVLLKSAIIDTLHVFGVPVTIEKFVQFMGPDFIKNAEVRETVIEAMGEQARVHMHGQNTPSALNSLIAVFSFSEDEMKPFMTEELKTALQNERWTSKEINDAHTEWLMEWEREGKGDMRGYEENFDNRTEMPKRRPK